MVKIKNIGEITLVDDEGYLPNISSENKIAEPWRQAVDETLTALKRELGDDLHSIYVRGSVVRGTAVAGVSDLDTISLVKPEHDMDSLLWRKDVALDLKQRFNFVSKFELYIIPLDKFLKSPDHVGDRFVLKTQGVCMYGEDATLKLPEYKLDYDLATSLYKPFPQSLEKVLANIKNPENRKVKPLCVWIMKRIIRAGFSLVMVDEQAFTRDLYPSYELFSKYYPAKRDEMYQALEWALNPSSNRAELNEFLETFGRWLELEIANRLRIGG